MSLIEFILQRRQSRLNEIEFQRRKQQPKPQIIRPGAPPTSQTVSSSGKRPVALFGSDYNEAFGLDWAASQKRSIPAPVMGVVNPSVSRPIVNNVQGRVVSGQPFMTAEKGYEDPNISRTFKRASESTNQRPVHQGGGAVTRWDGVVRNTPARPSIESSRSPRQQTESDKHAADLKRLGYDFAT